MGCIFSARAGGLNGSSNVTSYILEVARKTIFAGNMVYCHLGPNTTSHSVTYGTIWGGIWYYYVKAVNAYGTTVSSNDPSCFYTSVAALALLSIWLSDDNDSGLSLTPNQTKFNAPRRANISSPG